MCACVRVCLTGVGGAAVEAVERGGREAVVVGGGAGAHDDHLVRDGRRAGDRHRVAG